MPRTSRVLSTPRSISALTFTMLLGLIAAAIASFALLAQRTTRAMASDSQEKSGEVDSGQQSSAPVGCCGGTPEDPDNKPHTLAAAYYSLNPGLSATLMLNNKGPIPIEVYPTLYNLAGTRKDVVPVIVDPNSFRRIDLREWTADQEAEFREGSIQLFHKGKDLQRFSIS